MAAERVIIDTDPGIDDSHAVLFALLGGELNVDAVTTCFGNVDVATSASNALRLVELAGRSDIPVYRGAAEPLVQRRLPVGVGRAVHGKNGLGDVEFPGPTGMIEPEYGAVELARRVMAAPGEITVLSLAPMTNLALAIRLEPGFVEAVKRVIYMGGIVRGHGNVTPVATANIYNDAEAAKIVLNAGFRNLVMVGQDVTRRVRLGDDRRERLRVLGGELPGLLHQITEFYASYYKTIEPDLPGLPVHDLLVMVYALRPELFGVRRLAVDVETLGSVTTGMTVADFRDLLPDAAAEPNVDVCLEADSSRILDLYEQVMTEGFRRLAAT